MYDVFTQRTMEAVQEGCRKMPEVTLRDLFAMNALNAIIARCDFSESQQQYAEQAYNFADAMIKVRKQKN